MSKVKSTERKTFTVYRSRWGRNTLRSPKTGRQCCLGFVAEQCGVPTDALKDAMMPRQLCNEEQSKLPEEFICGRAPDTDDSELAMKAARINDNEKMARQEKERELRALFAKHGFRLRFVD